MKLGSVTKPENTNKKPSKKRDDDVMPANCDLNGTFRIYDQFGSIRKPDSRRIVCKIYIFIDSSFLSCKN